MPDEAPQTRRSGIALAIIGALALVAFAGFVALGTWQVHRLSWKRALIARVEARIHAAPVPVPPARDWSMAEARADAYRRVAITGYFLNDRETLVQAVTERGAGAWVLTPLQTEAGEVVFINRGFVPPERRAVAARRDGQIEGMTTVVGLMRVSEPGGGFLRHNDAAAGHWFSRDTQAMGAVRGFRTVAPFFIDADTTPNGVDGPIGGLTVVTFRDEHAIYAITWYGLALMVAGAIAMLVRDEWRLRTTQALTREPVP
jgi:surfeit locus 1 family protein